MNISFDKYQVQLLDTNNPEMFFHLLNENRFRLEEYFAGTIAHTKDLSSTKNYCELIQQRIEEKRYFPYVIIDVYTQKYIGLIDVKNIDWNIPKAELGYFIDHNYEGGGIISKALGFTINALVKSYGFKKLLCRINKSNKGSIAVALKNGFELEGTIRRDYKTTKGLIVDLNYYGRLF
jgi:RimJ/RimL family protein N-acetyltransferase